MIRPAKQLLQGSWLCRWEWIAVIKLLTIPIYGDPGTYVANELGKLGINIEVEVVQKSLLLEQTSKSQALPRQLIVDYPGRGELPSVFYSKNPAPQLHLGYKTRRLMRCTKLLREKNDSAVVPAFTSRWINR